jgi:hypothetical protein
MAIYSLLHLSIKGTGSISVERVAKPLKNRVASKDRNRLSNDKRALLLRVGLNLRLKRDSMQSICEGCSWENGGYG